LLQIELARKIREHGAKLPLVLFSSLGRRETGDIDKLFDAYLAKPIRQSQLFDTLVGLLVLEGSRATKLVIDCGGVTRADSAGLAVLLDWLAWGRRKSRTVTLENLPAPLVAIARISEVDGLLTATG